MPSMPPPLSSAQVLQQLSGQAAPSPTHLISETIPPSVSWLNLAPISPAGHPKLALSSQIQREPQPGMSGRSSQSPRQSQKPSSASKSQEINSSPTPGGCSFLQPPPACPLLQQNTGSRNFLASAVPTVQKSRAYSELSPSRSPQHAHRTSPNLLYRRAGISMHPQIQNRSRVKY